MSERKTEIITRDMINKLDYYENPNITVEEQTSDFKNIQSLLSNASKSGSGRKGFPEFIITSTDFPDYIIVIECKADLAFHASKNLNDPTKYNLDGALHYSDFLSKEYNVISIAITGTKKTNLLVSIYSQLKNSEKKLLKNNKGKEIKNLVSFEDFVELGGYNEEDTKAKLEDILLYSRKLDKFLREDAKLTEQQKPLAICGVLLALKNDNFRKNFNKFSIQKIPNEWMKALSEELDISRIPNIKKSNLLNQFKILKEHPQFIRKSKKYSNGAFFTLISEIRTKVFPYIDVLKNHDILGSFFNEFLKYSGGDKQSFGVVLTPHHITSFAAKLAELDVNTKVIDTCCGTGGFLVAAMNEMSSKAESKSDIKKILSQNIIGCEDLPEMFTLAVGNMILRGDGKSNIYQGDCFDEEIKKTLSSHKPDVGLINPPFSQAGDNLKELDYILNILDIVKKGGIVIGILPLNVINTDTELKREILTNHTLLASFSLPNQLFYPVGTVTSILVLKAKIPHPNNFKTWLAYAKDDGFELKVHRGRRDFENKWNSIEKNWLDLFINREEKKGFSLLKELSYGDEWCIEPYMETDYENLDKEIFKKMVNSFITYKINE